MRHSADYWIEKAAGASAPVGSPAWIAELNARALADDPHLVDLAEFPLRLERAAVAQRIEALSRPGPNPLYYRDGAPVTPLDYARYRESLALDSIPETVTVRFGLVLERADMRTWPNPDVVFRTPKTYGLDRFQENGLFPGEALAVLHESADRAWVFAQSYNYAAWLRRDRVALGPREAVLRFRDAAPFLVVTGGQVLAALVPPDERLPARVLDMGARLPLAGEAGPEPDGAWRVHLPVARRGELGFATARIAPGADVRAGYLPYTREAVVRQAFKFLGETYGWGHSLNARDCSGLVLEVYRSVGIFLPRNSGQQGASPIGRTVRFAPGTPAQVKLDALATAQPGDLLYAEGHVMMFLGWDEGEAWVIHDTSNTGGLDGRAGEVAGDHVGVLVTPLTPAPAEGGETYFETLYAIKSIG